MSIPRWLLIASMHGFEVVRLSKQDVAYVMCQVLAAMVVMWLITHT